MNERGHSIDPWRTPHEIELVRDFFSLFRHTVFYLLDMSRTIR